MVKYTEIKGPIISSPTLKGSEIKQKTVRECSQQHEK